MKSLLATFAQHSLHEGLSPLLYHFTYYNALDKILADNALICSGALGTDADMTKNNGRAFYFSTQRSKNSKLGYGGQNSKWGGRNVSLVLNGQKLQQQFRGRPADYWGWSRKQTDYKSAADYKQAMMATELEDRIITDQPTIEPANTYIQKIHLVFEELTYKTKAYLDRILANAQKLGITLYLYNNARDFSNQRKDKAVDSAAIPYKEIERDEEYEPTSSDEERTVRTLSSLAAVLMHRNHRGEKQLREYFPHRELPARMEEAIKGLDERLPYLSEWDVEEFATSWGADIHNSRTNTTPLQLLIMKLVTQDIRRNKCTGFKDYLYTKLQVRKPVDYSKPYGTEKPETEWVLYLDGERQYADKWKSRFWSWVSSDEFWAALPDDFKWRIDKVKKGKERAYAGELVDNEEATFQQVYNSLVKHLGRKLAHEVLSKCYVEVKKEEKPKRYNW